MGLLQQLTPTGLSVVESFVRQRTRSPEEFLLEVSPEDEMYLYLVNTNPDQSVDDWLLSYFESGAMMVEELRPIFDHFFGGFERVESLLEFACGHGRFTRYLVQEIPRERISASDIYAGAVEFQRREFGLRALLSAYDPSEYSDDNRYDCILVCSLFSHLPEHTFHLWLERLMRLLTDDGVLIFTVHDEAVAPDSIEMSTSGFGFVQSSESRSLDTELYGTTFVSEDFCRSAISRASAGEGNYARVPKGLWTFQDVYIASKRPMERLLSLEVPKGLDAYFERCHLSDDVWTFSGWAHDFRPTERVEQIEVLKDGERLQICLPSNERVDVVAHFDEAETIHSGWSCSVDARRLEPTSVISVRLTSSSGASSVIAFNSLEKLSQQLGG